MMYTKQELDVVCTRFSDTVNDEDLLSVAKYMYREGLLKASVKYDSDTNSNTMEYRITVVRTYRDEKDKKYYSTKEIDNIKNTNSVPGSLKDIDEHRGFFRRIFNLWSMKTYDYEDGPIMNVEEEGNIKNL